MRLKKLSINPVYDSVTPIVCGISFFMVDKIYINLDFASRHKLSNALTTTFAALVRLFSEDGKTIRMGKPFAYSYDLLMRLYPGIFKKSDTIYRHLYSLQKIGLISLFKDKDQKYLIFTDKSKSWEL